MKNAMHKIIVFIVVLSFAACAASQSNFKVGKQYYDEGNFEQAIIELEKASRHDTSIYDRFNAFEYLGDVYSRKGDLDIAVLSYKNAHKLMRERIGEIIDLRKTLKSDQRNDSSDNYKVQEKAEKLSDELSKMTMRAEEIQIKIKHLK